MKVKLSTENFEHLGNFLNSFTGEDSEDGRIIKTWHDNIEEDQLKVD